MENNDTFAVFILTHGRPDNVITLNTLKKCGYTGKIYFIVDNEDKTIDKYYRNFGKENVIVFDKKAFADQVDEGNNFDERRTITHARNACFEIAKDLNIKYFIELDDDYTSFGYKLIINNKEIRKEIKNMDTIFSLMLSYYKEINTKSIAMAQEGDFLGGISNGILNYRFSKRKCMNSFICSPERQFKFIGAMNEDVNTYTTLGSRGNLFLTICNIALSQKPTQTQKGGISDMYLRFGTYCKAFTTVMMMPSSVKVSMMKSNNPRIHHSIKWNNTVPLIISEKHKKL